MNLSFNDLIDEEQFKRAIKVTKKIAETGKQAEPGEYKLRTKDGNYIYIETYSIPVKKKGKIYAFLGIAKNITELRIAEKHLKESGERHRALYENTPFSILLINSVGEIVDCNPRTVELFEYKKSELIGKEFRKVQAIQLKDLQLLIDLFKRMISGETLHRVDIQLRKKDGTLIWSNLQASLVEIGNQTYVQAIFHDIDQHKKADITMEEQLKYLKEELESLKKK
ncbi:MAG: PAS domain S-box protein [Promethearchaeota archaeon]|nr:MAG: PAS domain S-box protein [Candidatus Lokiarchaeota archaeon]